MSGWVHVEEWTEGTVEGPMDPECVLCLRLDPEDSCATPTPDPASPCGYEAHSVAGVLTCRATTHQHDSYTFDHPYRPTRCTCGHPIEERA